MIYINRRNQVQSHENDIHLSKHWKHARTSESARVHASIISRARLHDSSDASEGFGADAGPLCIQSHCFLNHCSFVTID